MKRSNYYWKTLVSDSMMDCRCDIYVTAVLQDMEDCDGVARDPPAHAADVWIINSSQGARSGGALSRVLTFEVSENDNLI